MNRDYRAAVGELDGALEILERHNYLQDLELGDALIHLDNLRDYLYRLAEAATRDDLTGLDRRRSLDDAYEEFVGERRSGSERRGTKTEYSVIFFDVDNFKGYNGKFGEPQGDQALMAIGDYINEELRRIDVIATRYGGEEFALFLPNTGTDGAHEVAEKVRKGIASLTVPVLADLVIRDEIEYVHSEPERVTASVGVSTSTHYQESLDGVIARAVEGKRRAKEQGKNMVVAVRSQEMFGVEG